MKSSFNLFKQNGLYSLICLYSDGRLRFWDLKNLKCYIVTKFNFIKKL